jgi:hypothetical protein
MDDIAAFLPSLPFSFFLLPFSFVARQRAEASFASTGASSMMMLL